MSADTVDDLHEAEDMAGTLATALSRVLAAVDTDDDVGSEYGAAMDNARGVIATWSSYCRPTCGAEGDPEAAEETCDEPATCGCPCGHTDA